MAVADHTLADATLQLTVGTAVPEGQRIGRYVLLRRLGRGGMAEVFLARQEGPGDFAKTVVVKRMLPHLVENKRFVEMFLREAKVAARLNHPNVVQIFELGQDGDSYFLAMEFIDGITLHRLAKRAWLQRRALPTEVIVRAMADVALGLHHAHTLLDEEGRPAGLVHRDISPDNLMMTRDGITKVLDFGVAKSTAQRGPVTKTGELKGKIPYMSPEQIQGHPVDQRSDLFSLGVTFYWLLAGKRPFDGATEVLTLKRVLDDLPAPPSQVNDRVPAALDRLVLRLLEKDPDRRYASGEQVHDRLLALLGGEGAARAPAARLVAELIEVGDPEDEDPSALGGAKAPASEPISTTFAATAITATNPGDHGRRGALIGITAAATLGFAGAVTLLALRPWGAQVAPAPPLMPPPVVTPTPVTPAAAPPEPPPPPATPEPKPAEPEPAKRTIAAEGTRQVTLKGPSHLRWRLPGAKNARGSGSARIGAKVKVLTAVDTRRGSTHEVPVGGDVADFDALPTGTLRVQAVPFADVSLGRESLGQTPPLQPVTLPVGTYQVTLSWQGTKKTVTVRVERGKQARVAEKMGE
ncbi:MAG: hypothetical protein A2138_10635 [Deltaproteobacteria bacterium RBG_16_71_12]|nr:MAG: hypothetical protein A2138_10635 [Deltaproteobacteria bacterium RBG_16_71_12]